MFISYTENFGLIYIFNNNLVENIEKIFSEDQEIASSILQMIPSQQ